MTNALKPLTAVLLTAGLVSHVSIALAEDAPPAPAAPAAPAVPETQAKPQQLDSVMIVGKRRGPLREVAGTVTSLQGGQLEQRGAQDQEDVFKLVPGVQLNKGDPDRSLPTIRGVGTVSSSATLIQQATTGVYIDDVPFTDPFGFVSTADLAPFDLERIDVLRGPQGALYGSASLGGAVLYGLNKPNTKATEFSLLGTLNSVSHGGLGYSIYSMANLPLSQDAALRAVVFDRRDSGYINNLGTGNARANELRQRGGRLMGEVKVSSAVKVTGTLLTQKTDIDDAFVVSPDPTQLQVNTPSASTRSSEFSFGNLKIEADLGKAMLTSNTGYIDKKVSANTDVTRRLGNVGAAFVDPGLPAFAVVKSPGVIKGTAASQEFRIASSGDAALSYVAGAFYQRSTYSLDGTWNAPGGAAAWGPFGALLPGDNLLTENDSAVATETAVFADAEYRFSNGFSAGLGGRQYRNKLHYDVNSVLLLGPLLASHDLSENGFTPKATIKYRFGEHMWYALASKGYRFGGVNAGSGTTYQSDGLWNYETGLRLSPSQDVKLDLSAFFVDWKNAQVSAIVPGPVPLNGIANVGQAKIKGLEAALNWRVSPALGLNGALAYTDAQTSVDFTSNNGAIVPSGTPLPGTAKWQTSLQGSYSFEGPLQTAGRFDVTHSYIGKRTLTIDSGGEAPAYSQLDLRVSFAREHWEIGLFVNNVADKRGVAGGQPVVGLGTPNYTDYVLVKPRTVGLTLRYDL